MLNTTIAVALATCSLIACGAAREVASSSDASSDVSRERGDAGSEGSQKRGDAGASNNIDAGTSGPADASEGRPMPDARVIDTTALLAEAKQTLYECETPRGVVFFRYGAVVGEIENARLIFHPVGASDDGESCTALSDERIAESQKCVFYDNPGGRWALDLGELSEMAQLPEEITTPITNANDCEILLLQSGVTAAMCKAPYECKRSNAEVIAQYYAEAQETTYACDVRGGALATTVYFRYGYGAADSSEDYLYFYPVYNPSEPDRSCTDPASTEVRGIQTCVFFERGQRWSLFIGKPSQLTEMPTSITQAIATPFDCDRYLQEGITKQMCKASYTCTLLQ